MSTVVKLIIEVEFVADSKALANAAVVRMPSDLQTSIEHGHVQGVPTGIVPGSTRVSVRNKDMQEMPGPNGANSAVG